DAVAAASLARDGLAQRGHAGHGRVLVVAGAHGLGHQTGEQGIHRIVRKALAEVHRTEFRRAARNHGEDGGADVRQLAHAAPCAAASAAPTTPAAAPSAAGTTRARDWSSGANRFQFSTTPPPTTISSGQNRRLMSVR